MALKGLSEKVVVVTGAASGIGRASAARLVEEGAEVALIDIDPEGLESALDDLGRERTLGVRADVASEEDVLRAFGEVRERFGRIDALHNNAGIERPPAPLAEGEVEEFDRLIAINLRGAYMVMREMLRTAAAQSSPAAIVNTASGTALHAVPGMGLYGATKAGLILLTRVAAVESASAGVRVNAIAPGPIETPLFARLSDEVITAVKATIPMGRIGSVEEVAGIAAFLLSEEAPFITGAVYPIDGGETAA